MKNKSTNQKNIFVSEEEKTINWSDLQSEFKKNFGTEIYNSWLKNITLVKEYNDYLILGVPTRFFRDWIVSRYLDKILELVKNFKLSLSRIEFKIIEDQKGNKNEEFKGRMPTFQRATQTIKRAKYTTQQRVKNKTETFQQGCLTVSVSRYDIKKRLQTNAV